MSAQCAAPHLGLATTEELLTEIRVRAQVTMQSWAAEVVGLYASFALDNLSAEDLAYRTVDSR